jgi:predicted helicase
MSKVLGYSNMTGPGAGVEFGCLISNLVPNFHSMDTGQGYPRFLFTDSGSKKVESLDLGLDLGDTKTDAISDWALKIFRERYHSKVSKDDIFYYVYGVMSSPEFVRRYKNELKKDSPRVPLLAEFSTYVEFGRQLAQLHLNYENHKNDFVKIDIRNATSDRNSLYRVEKMKFGNGGDKSIIHFNSYVSLSEIPVEVYSYMVNGRPAVEWVMDRFTVKEDKDSGNVNDANEFSEDPEYILNLLLSIISMSKKVLEMQKELPKLVIPIDLN